MKEQGSYFRTGLRFAFLFLFLSPYLVLLSQVRSWQWPAWDELGFVLVQSSLQALLSAGASLIVGLLGALGLLHFQGKRISKWLEAWLLIPNIFPALFVIVSVIQLVSFFTRFPFGLGAVVLVHLFVNGGLLAVALSRLFQAKVGSMGELAWIEGASRGLFLWTLMKGLRRELGFLFLFVFFLCFTSFSVPLVVGGVSGSTLEVLIYEKLRLEGGWSQAVSLGVLQMTFLFLFSIVLRQGYESLPQKTSRLELLKWKWGLLIPLSLTAGLVMGSVMGWKQAWHQWISSPELHEWMGRLFSGTLVVGLMSGLLVALALLLVAYLMPSRLLDQFFAGFTAPSGVLTGFALLVVGGASHEGNLVRIGVGVFLLFFPSWYRLLGGTLINALRSQVDVARTMGASWGCVFRSVVFPQIIRGVGFLSGLAALWACGEFALSSIVATEDVTLALMARTFLSTYQLELSSLFVWLSLFCGLLCFLLFGGLGYVFGEKSKASTG